MGAGAQTQFTAHTASTLQIELSLPHPRQPLITLIFKKVNFCYLDKQPASLVLVHRCEYGALRDEGLALGHAG